jgi:hypothetical protein
VIDDDTTFTAYKIFEPSEVSTQYSRLSRVVTSDSFNEDDSF